MSDFASSLATTACVQCGAPLSPTALACPSCATLVHAEALRQLATQAEQATTAGDVSAALTAWRQAVVLLPPESQQYAVVQDRILSLVRTLDAGAAAVAPPAKQVPKALRWMGPVGVALWKFWSIILLVLTKAKLLLLGLTKLSTFLSMAASFGLYWTLWGWKWALGLVLTTYVHEMGHVFALRRYGLPASAPMFIPGLGAFVRLKQHPATVEEDAAIGLAGPIWGCTAALVCFAVYRLTGWTSFAAAGRTAAWINLFNLLPLWTLDGGRGFRALSRPYRFMAGATALIAGYVTHDGMVMAVGGVGVVRALGGDAPAEGDRQTLLTYVGLILILAAVASFRFGVHSL